MNIYKDSIVLHNLTYDVYRTSIKYLYLKETYQLDDVSQNLYESIISKSNQLLELSKKIKYHVNTLYEIISENFDDLKSSKIFYFSYLDKLMERELKELSSDVYIDEEFLKKLCENTDKFLKFIRNINLDN